MDRPIFKFKKSQSETRHIKLAPMKMYRNFEDLEDEVQSPTKGASHHEPLFSSFY